MQDQTVKSGPAAGKKSGLTACSSSQEVGHCITCSDEAWPARVLSIDSRQAAALVVVEGETVEIDISLIDTVERGDILLVHGGVALTRLDREDFMAGGNDNEPASTGSLRV